MGSPGSLAQALGSGLRDFISLPFQGLLQGPWGFIVGITHGSASLMRHVTAGSNICIRSTNEMNTFSQYFMIKIYTFYVGTLNSVTKLASSVARNLDRSPNT